jgi:hypothetical protein
MLGNIRRDLIRKLAVRFWVVLLYGGGHQSAATGKMFDAAETAVCATGLAVKYVGNY